MPDTLALFSLKDKVALVTGAGRGLGLEIARHLAGAGAHVYVNGRDAARLSAPVAAIVAEGGKAQALAFDVADETAVTAAFATIAKAHGRLDVLVNNVGLRNRKAALELTAAEVRSLIDADLVSAFLTSRAAAQMMIPRRWGRIINVTSIAGPLARHGDPAYAAAKAGLAGLTRALAADFGPHEITVNGIAPGFFATETNAAIAADPELGPTYSRRTMLGRWGRPEEIAGAAVFLASEAASFVTGHILTVDGGTSAQFWP
jgi:gluconate 5-dehydrogenase